MGRGDDLARAPDFLRPAWYRSFRSGQCGRATDVEQWADSITAVLGDLDSREAVLVAVGGGLTTAALFAATHPSRTTALIALEVFANQEADRTDGLASADLFNAAVAVWGTGTTQRVHNPDMPWNEEIRATWAREERLAASPATVGSIMPLLSELNVRAVLPTIRVPTLVVHHSSDETIPPTAGIYVAHRIAGAKYVELPGRNMYHFVEPWRESFQEIAEFLTGQQQGARHRAVHRHRGLDTARCGDGRSGLACFVGCA